MSEPIIAELANLSKLSFYDLYRLMLRAEINGLIRLTRDLDKQIEIRQESIAAAHQDNDPALVGAYQVLLEDQQALLKGCQDDLDKVKARYRSLRNGSETFDKFDLSNKG